MREVDFLSSQKSIKISATRLPSDEGSGFPLDATGRKDSGRGLPSDEGSGFPP